MPGRRRTGLWIASALGLAIVAGLSFMGVRSGRSTPKAKPVVFDAKTPLADLVPALRDSDVRALNALAQRLTPKEGEPVLPVEEAESKSWFNVLSAVRTGFPKFGGYGRVTALSVTAKVLNRFTVETAPPSWTKVLPLTSDIFISGMVAPEIDVKVNALLEVGKLWGWTPGKTPEPLEEDALVEWKSSLLRSATGRCLGDVQPKVRAAAVACLGNLPIDEVVKPAVACLEDTRPGAGEVRRQVLISFARRRALLSEDAVLKLLYDPEPGIPEMAEIVLRTRGLTKEQISLGRMIFHPKPELRASVITLLRDRTDIDPVVWLLQLSHDTDESVRTSAVEALSSKLSPEVRRRLAEMAKTDRSPTVRQAAGKVVPPDAEKTAALPPLPGSPNLNPKAN